ncbi:hypothetical protein RHS01_10428 [Rhizoctonia solani]|uniref:Uncharacterized protein n=1 Tax=Rhizoctonia solani TaxID=456999 RepID=A0A8H7M2I7_9AGAM|nr:hypothetical protein RHS01_10428 [Rhizoctonia solani]
MAFAVFDLLPENQDIVCAWLLLGCLTLLLWYTEIENIREYTAELQALIDDFLLITAQCSPAILILKPKFHFLVHLPYYIRWFGPALLFSTERFESFNGVFWAASTFSNCQSPLHDIAERFAQLDCAKHICAGGYWKQGNCWVCVGGALLRFVSTNAAFAPIFRIPKQKTWIPGEPHWRASVQMQTWEAFVMQEKMFIPAPGSVQAQYYPLLSITSQSGNSVKPKLDIIFDTSEGAKLALPNSVFVQTPLGMNHEEVMTQAVNKMKNSKECKDIIAMAKKDAKAMLFAAMQDAEAQAAKINDLSPKTEKVAEFLFNAKNHLSFNMGCASSDNKYNIEVEDEEEDQMLPQAQPRGLQTLVSAQTNVFELVGNSQVTLSSNLMLFADGCCEEFGLANALKEDVLQTAKLPPQFLLTCLYACTVAFGKHIQNTKVDLFLTLRKFKETVTQRLQAGLLDLYITWYVDGTTAWFVRHIIENPASYEIPMAVQAQFMHSKLFLSAVGRVLSTFWGEVQQKESYTALSY